MKVNKEYWTNDKETLVLRGYFDSMEVILKFSDKLISGYVYDKKNNPETWHVYSQKVMKFIVEYFHFADYYIQDEICKERLRFPNRPYKVPNNNCKLFDAIIIDVPKKWFEHSGLKNLFNPKRKYIRKIDIGY